MEQMMMLNKVIGEQLFADTISLLDVKQLRTLLSQTIKYGKMLKEESESFAYDNGFINYYCHMILIRLYRQTELFPEEEELLYKLEIAALSTCPQELINKYNKLSNRNFKVPITDTINSTVVIDNDSDYIAKIIKMKPKGDC